MSKGIHLFALGLLAGSLLSGCLFGIGAPPQPTPTVEAYFTYPGTTRPYDDNPERSLFIPLLSQLGEGDRLDIAIYIFSDDQIGDAVERAWENGAEVRIFTESKEACKSYSEISRLAALGIPVRVDNHSGIMHNKFAVVNGEVVITGSYNWSDSADRKNWENVVVIRIPEVAQDYAQNFETMWENASPFSGCSR